LLVKTHEKHAEYIRAKFNAIDQLLYLRERLDFSRSCKSL